MKWITNGIFAASMLASTLAFAVQSGQPVNVNKADAIEIAEQLNGVGVKKAEAIIEYREAHGPFKTLEDLKNVKGIGDATVSNNEKLILLD